MTAAGTLAIPGALLDNATTAPPSGAPTLSTMVPVDPLPPVTVDGLVDMVESVAGGGAACGVNVRTADQAPATPLTLTPRTRQKCGTVARLLVAYMDVATVGLADQRRREGGRVVHLDVVGGGARHVVPVERQRLAWTTRRWPARPAPAQPEPAATPAGWRWSG